MGYTALLTYFKLHGLVYIPFPSESIEADRLLPMIFTILKSINLPLKITFKTIPMNLIYK